MISFLIACFGLVALGFGLEQAGLWRDRQRYPSPGRLIKVAGTRLHIVLSPGGRKSSDAEGDNEPAVVLEAGIAGSLLGWSLVQSRIAQFATVCSYDRAGLGWSAPAKQPRTLANMTAELEELLGKAGINPPYLLVGHSFGGLLVRAFAEHRPEQVAGLVLVDPVSSRSWSRSSSHGRKVLKRGVHLSKRGAWLARIGVVRVVLSILARGGRHVPKLVGQTAASAGTSMIERLLGEVRLLPAETAPWIRSHWSSARCFKAMSDYLEALPSCAERSLGFRLRPAMPVTILSASTATAEELEERDAWAAESMRGRHIGVADCGHWIQIRRPDVVVEAVREMVAELSELRGSSH